MEPSLAHFRFRLAWSDHDTLGLRRACGYSTTDLETKTIGKDMNTRVLNQKAPRGPPVLAPEEEHARAPRSGEAREGSQVEETRAGGWMDVRPSAHPVGESERT